MATADKISSRRLARLVYVPAVAAIIGICGIVAVFTLGDRRQALDRAQTNLNFTVESLADDDADAIRAGNLTDEQMRAERLEEIARARLLYPSARIWFEQNGVVVAGNRPTTSPDQLIVVDKTRRLADLPHAGFSVHAALPMEDALAHWTISVYLRAIELLVMTAAFLFMANRLARAIRQRAVAEDEIRTAMKTLVLRDRALEAITQGITVTDDQVTGRPIIYTNPAFAALTRYDTAEILGRGPFDFFDLEKTPGLSDRMLAARAMNLPLQMETEVRRKDGTTFLDHASSALIVDDAGTVTHTVTVHEDVTELRRREEMLLQAQKLEGIGQLTGGIAHDFNNLLTAIRSNAEDLKDDLKDKPLSMRQADIVLQAAMRGAGLVAQLMAFARKQELQPQNENVGELINAFTHLTRSALPRNIKVDVRVGDHLPKVFVDAGRFESVLLNLCNNACDAMPDGGTITIEAMTREIDIDYVREVRDVLPGSYVLIAVTDTGSGMSREVMEKAFTPFFTTKEVGKGTGLGLSMVYGFVKQSGGHARIYSEEGFGTVVKIYLPAVDAAAESEPAGMQRSEHGSGSILIVEDDELVRQSISAKLTGFGYEVLTAPTAYDAIEILNATPHFDLVFSDVIMPGAMTGADLVREVRRRWPKMNVLLTSGYTESTVHGKVDVPADVKLLSKPYSNAELAQTVRAAIGTAA